MTTMANPPQSLVTLKNVSFSYNQQTILHQINLTIEANQILTCIGPNGSGKTTLARIILGLEKPSSGAVLRKMLRIGYMPQKLHIETTLPLKVENFLCLGLPRFEKFPQAAHQRLFDLININGLLKQSIHTLSGGEFQRVLLVRALLRKPELLVLDEPVQGVDVSGQIELYQLITRIQQEYGCAIFMISHDLHLVMAATHQVICLNHHICCRGHPDQIKQDPEFLSLFGGEAAKYLAIYTHDTKHDHAHDPHHHHP